MSYLASLTPAQLNRAAKIKEKIEALNRELVELLGADAATPAARGPRQTKFSPAGLERIRAAQKRRWARIKSITGKSGGKTGRKRNFSPDGLARIRAAQKARWAKAKAEKASA
jgi:hypothetical protein